MEDITIYQGDNGTIKATIKSGLSDLTGYTGFIIGKEKISSNDIVFDLSTNNWDASTGLFEYSQNDSSTAVLGQYEFYVSSSPENNHTVGQGKLKIKVTYRKK